jgi:hypothetical protein
MVFIAARTCSFSAAVLVQLLVSLCASSGAAEPAIGGGLQDPLEQRPSHCSAEEFRLGQWVSGSAATAHSAKEATAG